MKTLQKFALSTITAVILVSVVGCAGMSRRDECTVMGAGIGAVGGAVLTEGSAVGTVGGAAVGGVIGNQIKCR
jgi:osmotically inducible lipoprotein OsmB